MSYFLALLLGFAGQGAMNTRLAKGDIPFMQTVILFGILGSLPFLLWFGISFGIIINDPYASASDLLDSMTLPAVGAGAYWLIVFIGLWRSAGKLGTGKMLICRYFSVTWLSSAAACFLFVAKVPCILMIAAYLIAKRARAKKEGEIRAC